MNPKRIMVVEDEFLLALDLEAALQNAGYVVLGPVGAVEEAIDLALKATPDAALLDANLNGFPVDRVAETLNDAGIPFLFVSGYGRDSLPERFRDKFLVSKPFEEARLLGAIAAMLTG